MAKEVKYGIISDTHQNPSIVPYAINVLRNFGVEKMIVNGDVGTGIEYMAFVVDCLGKSGLETYIQPGSHETLKEYVAVMSHFSSKYSNIIDTVGTRKVEFPDHHLVFMPGSDFSCGGEFVLALDNENESKIHKLKDGNSIFLINIKDLSSLVTSPDKTIVVSHVLRKFDNLETGVDVAEFGEVYLDFPYRGEFIKTGSIFPMPHAERIAGEGYPVRIKKENRGNVDLRAIYEKLGIKKSITGHFHESVHRATDKSGNKVQEGIPTEELFWNASYLDGFKAGILSVNGEKVNYQNLDLKKIVRNAFDKRELHIEN